MNKSIKTVFIPAQTRNGNLLKTSLPWPVFFRLFPDMRIKMSYWINRSVIECLQLGDARKLKGTKQENVERRQGMVLEPGGVLCFMEKMDRWTTMGENKWQTLATSYLQIKRKSDNEKEEKFYVRQAKKWRKIMLHVGLYRKNFNVAAFVQNSCFLYIWKEVTSRKLLRCIIPQAVNKV